MSNMCDVNEEDFPPIMRIDADTEEKPAPVSTPQSLAKQPLMHHTLSTLKGTLLDVAY